MAACWVAGIQPSAGIGLVSVVLAGTNLTVASSSVAASYTALAAVQYDAS